MRVIREFRLGRIGRWAMLVAVSAPLLAAPAGAAPGDDEGVLGAQDLRPVAKVEKVAPARLPSERLAVDLGALREIRLGPVDLTGLLAEDSRAAGSGLEKRLRVGIVRPLTVAAGDGFWTDLANGDRLWALEVSSQDALFLRLHFSRLALPAGAELAVTSAASDGPGEYRSAAAIREDRQVTVFRAGGRTGDAWTPTSAGERVRIELLLPASAGAGEGLPFVLGEVLHLYRDPLTGTVQGAALDKAAGPCHNDVSCYPEWANVAAAVARILFIEGGSGYLCTGQLLNDKIQDFTPYFLTANHCIDNGDAASTVQFFWRYQTDSCGGTPPAVGSVPQSSGASLVSTNPSSDYSLLIAEGTLPNVALYWAGWTSLTIPSGTLATSIHHPAGDFKRISFATAAYGACPANHVRTDWYSGPTEGGSSGGGVFRDSTQQLFGQLHGGPSACGNETYDCYGSFATTYKVAAVKNALTKGGSDDKSEPNDSCAKARSVPRSSVLPGRIVKILDEDWYRMTVPKGKTLDIRLDFSHANGDIDLEFYGSCNGEPLFFSRGIGDSEVISVTNVSPVNLTFWWRVYLADDPRNSYDLTAFVH